MKNGRRERFDTIYEASDLLYFMYVTTYFNDNYDVTVSYDYWPHPYWGA